MRPAREGTAVVAREGIARGLTEAGTVKTAEQCSRGQMEATMQNEHAAWYMPMHMHATRTKYLDLCPQHHTVD